MKAQPLLIACLVMSAFCGVAQADVFGYTLDVTTQYSASLPAGTLTPFGGPSPDTGFWTIKNDGTTTFSGTVGQVTNIGGGGNFNFTTGTITLAPGQSISVAVNSESSNQGGYNGVTGTTQNGVEIQITGTINGTESVNLSVFDKDIHSGVPRTNPFGVTLDNYVLQGGDPLGRDTGDAFEESQANGQFRFFEAAPTVPEPTSILLLVTVVGLAGRSLKRKLV